MHADLSLHGAHMSEGTFSLDAVHILFKADAFHYFTFGYIYAEKKGICLVNPLVKTRSNFQIIIELLTFVIFAHLHLINKHHWFL